MKKGTGIRGKLTTSIVRELGDFVQRVAGQWSKPQQKLTREVLEGILRAGSVRLSQIGRMILGSETLDSVEKRLSRMLGHSDIDIERGWVPYWESVRSYLTEGTVFAVDFGDITKPYSRRQAYLGRVYDGSTGGLGSGWHLLSVEALLSRRWGYRRHLPIYTEIFSPQAPGFSSQNDVLQTALTQLVKAFGVRGLWTFDQGFDALWFFRTLNGLALEWVVRVGGDRRVESQERKSVLLGSLVEKIELTHRFPHPGKKHAGEMLKLGWTSVYLGPEKERHTLIVVQGLAAKPLLLLSHQTISTGADLIRLARGYLLRWAVEEEFRLLKKGVFELEDIRVRLWPSLQRLVAMAVWAYGFLARLALLFRNVLTKILDASPHFRKPARFIYYRLSQGVAALLI